MKESKLQLNRETLLPLSSEALEQANGGTAFSVLTKVPSNVWAGGLTALGTAAKWAIGNVKPKVPLSGRYGGPKVHR